MVEKRNTFNDAIATLERNTRGAQIGIYTIAGIGLAIAIHKVRPGSEFQLRAEEAPSFRTDAPLGCLKISMRIDGVKIVEEIAPLPLAIRIRNLPGGQYTISKFSRIADIPEHFIQTKEVLRGRVVGCQPSAEGPRLLVDHTPLIKVPFWHAGKPPLPVQVWGVKLIGGNGVSWLQCVAVGQKVEITPLSRASDALIADVTLQLPVIPIKIDTKKKQKKTLLIEELRVGERLVELGLGVISTEVARVPAKVDSKWFLVPWILQRRTDAEMLQQAQSRAMAHRAGLWQDSLPRSRLTALLNYIKSLIPAVGGKKLPVL